jgi:hypothetical protein
MTNKREAKQWNWVYNQLKSGKVSRNKALANYISRLSHYIYDMRLLGVFHPYVIKGGNEVRKVNGKRRTDYVYRLVRND